MAPRLSPGCSVRASIFSSQHPQHGSQHLQLHSLGSNAPLIPASTAVTWNGDTNADKTPKQKTNINKPFLKENSSF